MRLSPLHYLSYNTSLFYMTVIHISFVCLMKNTPLLITRYLKKHLRSFSVLLLIRTTPLRYLCSPQVIERYGGRPINSSSRHPRMRLHCSRLRRASSSFASTVKAEKARKLPLLVPALMLMLMLLVEIVIIVALQLAAIIIIVRTRQLLDARHK